MGLGVPFRGQDGSSVLRCRLAPCPRGARTSGSTCVAISIPENGELNYLGNDWTCKRGYRRTGDRCVEVQVPPNAELNYLGNDWTCSRGYRRTGASCAVVQVPENAELNYLGNDWTCKRGYRKAGPLCEGVRVPADAELDYLGNGWKCKRGFRKAGTGCVQVELPENAELDVGGNEWMCQRGFRKTGAKCIPMSEKERLLQERAIAVATARARRINSSTCDIDGKPADGDRGEVIIYKSGCRSYFIADGPNGDYLLEWFGGHDPTEGDIIIGPINSYGCGSSAAAES